MAIPLIPRSFVWRRLHSLLGLWLVLFLINHLLVNSQAALLLGDNAQGFVHAVNSIHSMPYLPVIEIFLIGVPIFFHAIWGIYITYQAKFNSIRSDGKTPYVQGNKRNYAFIWQRVSGLILFIGIILHVIHFRFMHAPKKFQIGHQWFYFVKVQADKGLYTVASRLNAQIYGIDTIAREKMEFESSSKLVDPQEYLQRQVKIEMLEKATLKGKEVIAIAKDVGVAFVLSVRDVFKDPWMSVLYTIFVISACSHGLNGLWTFCLTWGFFIKASVQRVALFGVWGLMAIIASLGFVSIWGTYWLNLKV